MHKIIAIALLCASAQGLFAAQPTFNVWPAKPPGEVKELPPEQDFTKPEDRLIAGRRIIKLGNVSTPTVTIYQPPADKANGACVVVCPGGGHHILALDLEGTEVAEWLNSIGVTAAVLKYRVPTRTPDKRYQAAVQDAQRTMSLVRSKAEELKIDPKRIGILGFSAGGETAALTSLLPAREYEKIDEVDAVPWKPNFAVLIYTGALTEANNTKLRDYVRITRESPPAFFVHTFVDDVHVANSVLPFLEYKNAGVPAELHVYSEGVHGYGLRKTDEPVTEWPAACEKWLRISGWLEK